MAAGGPGRQPSGKAYIYISIYILTNRDKRHFRDVKERDRYSGSKNAYFSESLYFFIYINKVVITLALTKVMYLAQSLLVMWLF